MAVFLLTLLTTFGLIFIAELPDKTALATLVLATKYKPWPVILGAWVAFLIQTLVAVLIGSIIHLLPATPLKVACGLGFLIFAYLAWKHNEKEESKEEKKDTKKKNHIFHQPWMISFLVVFAAEWGDLTQLATAALVAHSGQIWPIAIGATAALWTVTIIAVFVGSQMTRFVSQDVLKNISVGLFAVVGIIMIVTAFV
ncbi:MAG: TMEM165/GDT1 family protein [Candidatus Levyibacteriota bacterium]